jgi:monofunctional biosynthetic peptidoglycan transglycosylase
MATRPPSSVKLQKKPSSPPAPSGGGARASRVGKAAGRGGKGWGKGGGKGGGLRRWGRWALGLWLAAVVWLTVAYVRLPQVTPLLKENPRSTALMDQRAAEAREEGKKPRQRQAWVPLTAIAPHAQAAVVLSEDARFFKHEGVDWVEVEAALHQAREEGKLGRGASTLTQQLAKNLYLSTDRSLLRKLKEMVLAHRLEEDLPKARILTLYLNVVEWGEGVYGIEAAAREHFRTSAKALTVAQGAMLAAMLPAPRRWLPAQRPAVLRRRAGVLVDRMEQAGRITPAQAAEGRAELARFFGGPSAPPAAPASPLPVAAASPSPASPSPAASPADAAPGAPSPGAAPAEAAPPAPSTASAAPTASAAETP